MYLRNGVDDSSLNGVRTALSLPGTTFTTESGWCSSIQNGGQCNTYVPNAQILIRKGALIYPTLNLSLYHNPFIFAKFI
jgi:hypothetical protein